jgi:hypothetical protein
MNEIRNELLDNGQWFKAPFGGFSIGDPFRSIAASIIDEISEDIKDVDSSESPHTKGAMADYINTINEEYYVKHNGFMGRTDSSIGGNDALNPLWQFNVDDDIVWDAYKVDNTGRGLGRVYAEMYQNTQHILWLSFGVPKFIKLTEFYKNAGDKKLQSILTKDGASLSYKIGAIVGSGVKLAIKLPWYPLIGLIKGVEAVADALVDVKINKYYEFIPKMDLYYKTVVTILSHLTVGMNLSPNGEIDDKNDTDVTYLDKKKYTSEEIKDIQNNAPEILRNGPDILYILSKRERWEHPENQIVNTDTMTKRMLKRASTTFGFFNDAIFKKYQYIGFRIERGTDASESVSNSTGEAEIAGKLNSQIAARKEKEISMGSGSIAKLTSTTTAVKSAIEGVSSGDVGSAGIALVSQGSGFFDIPEVWKNSSFSKSYTFDIQLRARYGDPLTIYQSIYIPLAMLMAGAFPIGLGKNTYTSPFLCQAFSRGMFSIPTGIIESMTIKRGLPEHGWTFDHLPTAVDISISIKDLSPAMFLSLIDANVMKVLNGNDSMKMYLSTLAGLNIFELTNKLDMFLRRCEALVLINKKANFNPKMWSIKASNLKPVKAVVALKRGSWKVPDV